jgi:hypothetical protein
MMRRIGLLNLGRIALAAALFASNLPSLARWRWHDAFVAGGLSLFAIDWFVGVWLVKKRRPIYLAGGIYTAATALGFVLVDHHPPRRVMIALAAIIAAAAVAAVALALREGRRTTELDRLIFSEASSLAFFAMMVAVITTALIDDWLGFHAPSLWVFAGIGAVAWLVARSVVRSRYS